MKTKQLKLEIKDKGPGQRPGTVAKMILKDQIFGGSFKNRKFERPFDSTKAVHVILRSKLLTGTRSLLKANRKEWTEKLVKAKAKKYQAKLYTFSINSNHIHLLIRFTNQQQQRSFFKDFSGSLALKIRMAFQLKTTKNVWDGRPFSRIVKHIPTIKAYIQRNKNEASGFWPYQERPISYLEKLLIRLEHKACDRFKIKSYVDISTA